MTFPCPANSAAPANPTHPANLDFFSKAPTLRGKTAQVTALFDLAHAENKDLALRGLLWLRDIRGGAGERQMFRDILKHLCITDPNSASRVVYTTPEVGRWDDLLSTTGGPREFAHILIGHALLDKDDRLAAKWMPRKGPDAEALRKHLKLSYTQYRKLLVGLSRESPASSTPSRYAPRPTNPAPHPEGLSPEDAMVETLMVDRYKLT